jgi:hypothetical protein
MGNVVLNAGNYDVIGYGQGQSSLVTDVPVQVHDGWLLAVDPNQVNLTLMLDGVSGVLGIGNRYAIKPDNSADAGPERIVANYVTVGQLERQGTGLARYCLIQTVNAEYIVMEVVRVVDTVGVVVRGYIAEDDLPEYYTPLYLTSAVRRMVINTTAQARIGGLDGNYVKVKQEVVIGNGADIVAPVVIKCLDGVTTITW